ncbi:MAG TPA: carbamate kinase [Gemmatimonadaceae bacterium]|nr:carbamate kinase [Gemmatimonadaceae bacterium]
MNPPTKRTAVIALGGNALSQSGERATAANQFRHTRESLASIVDLALEGWNLCIVHGNGPQVGDALLRNEIAGGEVEPLPLGLLVAATAGWIGYMIQQSLGNALRRAGSDRDVVSIITQVEVARNDPALENPTKPIGHDLTEERARKLEGAGETVREAEGHWRRVVGSPRPLAVHELAVIRALVQRGTIVVACGGGGVPAYRDETLGLEGVDAVVDKDLAAAALARGLEADLFMILTNVESVYSDFGTDRQQALAKLTVADAERLDKAGAFGEGSMAPKVRAAVDYVRRTRGRAIITELARGREAVRGEAGTTILP